MPDQQQIDLQAQVNRIDPDKESHEILEQRDNGPWELDPKSSEDYGDRRE